MSHLNVMKHRLANMGLHVDFLRLRCGFEGRFIDGIDELKRTNRSNPAAFFAFSEWDAVTLLPSPRLYPRALTDLYANDSVATSISGTSGFFAYLWEHRLNLGWESRLFEFESSGPTILASFRFEEWFRQDVGLGSEILFLDFLQSRLERQTNIRAIVAHSLGWNDLTVLLNAQESAQPLTQLFDEIRQLTLGDLVAPGEPLESFTRPPATPVFVASYSHLIGGFRRYTSGNLTIADLSEQIASARFLVRVLPAHEETVRTHLRTTYPELAQQPMPSEMGHYSFSVDITRLAQTHGSTEAIAFIGATRKFIGELCIGAVVTNLVGTSYAETSTRLQFAVGDPSRREHQSIPSTPDLVAEIEGLRVMLEALPELLRKRGVSPMTIHRFASVLTNLLDHLADPVRSSVVRHLSRFLSTTRDVVMTLDRDGMDDLCQILEYALGQAIDGVAQFQRDAVSLGLSGRGGYSRLIVTVEWYIRAFYISFGLPIRPPLITFGLRSGNAGSSKGYQIDLPFNVLFVPSRWYILMHELGHIWWMRAFGWMTESLTVYRAMEKEIQMHIPGAHAQQVHVEFLRTRELVRELFPSFLTFVLSCGRNIAEFDELALRRLMSMGRPYPLTRELLVLVVMHAMLVIIDDTFDADAARTLRDDPERAAAWWRRWRNLIDTSPSSRIDPAIQAVNDALMRVADETVPLRTRSAAPEEGSRREWREAQKEISSKTQILHSDPFREAAAAALGSVIRVLGLTARHFDDPKSDQRIASPLFGLLLSRLASAREEQKAYAHWSGEPFAEWLTDGEVLASAPFPQVWTRLLIASRKELLAAGDDLFLRSQLACLLSMWHRAVTSLPSGAESDRKLVKILRPLELVREKRWVDRPSVHDL